VGTAHQADNIMKINSLIIRNPILLGILSAADQTVEQQGLQIPPSVEQGDDQDAILFDTVDAAPGTLDQLSVLMQVQRPELRDPASPPGIGCQGGRPGFEPIEDPECGPRVVLGDMVDDGLQISARRIRPQNVTIQDLLPSGRLHT